MRRSPSFSAHRNTLLPAAAVLLALLSSSCGKGAALSGKGASGAPAGEDGIPRPHPADSSGWFAAPGPERLDGSWELYPGAGAGILDAAPLGADTLVLDFFGRVFHLPGGGEDAAWKVRKFPGDSMHPASAIAGRGDRAFLAEEGGLVRTFRLSGETGTFNPSEAWSSSPGFASDWILPSEAGYLACLSSEGRIAVLSESDGSTLAFLDLGVPLAGRPAVSGTTLLVPKVSGISALGLPDLGFLWKGEAAPFSGRPVWTFRGIAAFQDTTGAIRVLDADSGKERYSIPAAGPVQAAGDGERLYVAGSDGSLSAYNLSDGVPVWTAGAFLADGSGQRVGRFSPCVAATAGRVYLAGPEGVEAWDAHTGELLERAHLPGPADGIWTASGNLIARMRDGSLRVFGNRAREDGGMDLEAPARPPVEAAERIAASLGKYSDPGAPSFPLAWRIYVPGAALLPGLRCTVFRYEASEAGKRVFQLETPEKTGILMAVYDSEGQERHANVGELGVDLSFEQWLEPGVWYAVLGRLRGSAGTEPAFLTIR